MAVEFESISPSPKEPTHQPREFTWGFQQPEEVAEDQEEVEEGVAATVGEEEEGVVEVTGVRHHPTTASATAIPVPVRGPIPPVGTCTEHYSVSFRVLDVQKKNCEN